MPNPPLFYRLVVNPIRAWIERDDRLRVEHFKDTFKPSAKVIEFRNLKVARGKPDVIRAFGPIAGQRGR
jgi:hypothetical protein